LKFINDYLEIEKVRFSDRLEVVEEISADSLNASVPNFLLQPIVENAIRYAIAPRKSKGRISISSSRREGRLRIVVEDNGPGLAAGKESNSSGGVGLRVTAERLLRLFGENHIFSLASPAGGGVSVLIEIPFIEMIAAKKVAFHGA
jgi:LytS/YehU family sensor histidine kinase